LASIAHVGALNVLPAGSLGSETAAQVLTQANVTSLLADLRERADVVVFDAPAVLAGLETSVLADKVDAGVIVASVGYADREDIRRAAALLSGCAAPSIGVILNEFVQRGKPPI
jgi:Mrp family chromosome partitioning ATPase